MDPLASLRDARPRHVPWRDVARDLLMLEETGPLDGTGQPWLRVAEAVSGYSANHLRRMSKAWRALGTIGMALPDHRERLFSLSFSHAEVISRLWQADQTQTRILLAAERWLSYSDLLALYERARSSRGGSGAAGKLAMGALRARVHALLVRRFGAGDIIAPYVHHPYAKPDFLHIAALLEPTVVAAYDCLLVPARIDVDTLRRRFVSFATEASFFSAFWLVLSSGAAADPVWDCIHDLDLENVGMLLAEGPDLEVLSQPGGPPNPDRRKSYARFMAANGARILERQAGSR